MYFIAFLDTPSTLGIWMLLGGHHLATNLTYGSGNVTGASLKSGGVGPLSFTTTNSDILPSGTTYSLQTQEQAGMLTMMSGLTTIQKATVLLSGFCGDMVVGPQKDGGEKRTSNAKGGI